MSFVFSPYRENRCCLCGGPSASTGEHKIKKSILKSEFGSGKMLIGSTGDPFASMKLAQSVKSKLFHFKAKICDNCNSARTQSADREFELFHKEIRNIFSKKLDPGAVFDQARYTTDSTPYLNVFRYLAKILSCQIADIGAPIPNRINRFALATTNANCIWLQISEDLFYNKNRSVLGDHKYAAHGGLVAYGDRTDYIPNALQSTLSLGNIKYIFYTKLSPLEQQELQLFYHSFFELYRECIRKSVESGDNEVC